MQRVSGHDSSSTDGWSAKVPKVDLHPSDVAALKNTISVLDYRSSPGCGDLLSGESAFDTVQGGGGFLGSVVGRATPPKHLSPYLANLNHRGFPLKGLGVLIAPVKKTR
jgi:hypothetical protein